MNPDVTVDAALVYRTVHVVGRGKLHPHAVGLAAHVARAVVALQANREHHRPRQHPRVGGAVRDMAGHAAVHAKRRMLEHERAALVRVALGADRILIGSRPEIAVPEY